MPSKVFPNARASFYRSVYDKIFTAHALIPQSEMPRIYSLAIMIDAFEHLPPKEGEALLKVLKLRAESVLVCVPARPPYNPATLKELGFSQVLRVNNNYVALLGRRRIRPYGRALRNLSAVLPQWSYRTIDSICRKFHS